MLGFLVLWICECHYSVLRTLLGENGQDGGGYDA